MRKLFPLVLAALVAACDFNPKYNVGEFKGETMGTWYTIKYRKSGDPLQKGPVDSLLEAFNMQVSTYIPESGISRINSNPDTTLQELEGVHLVNGLFAMQEIHWISDGAFDPTVMPLVNYYGFGYEGQAETIDSAAVDSIRSYVGLDKWFIGKSGGRNSYRKPHPNAQLDLSACAKGQGVDLLAAYLDSMGLEHYMVEIGGEVVAKGTNLKLQPWTIGIEQPLEGERSLQAAVRLKDMAMATSGNYRNYKETDGQKVVHTIHPKTGYPEVSNLLSATIFAENCLEADGYATACMVLGLDKCREMLSKTRQSSASHLQAYLIYSEEGELKVWMSDEVEDWILRSE